MFYFIKRAFEETIQVKECRKISDYLIPSDGEIATAVLGSNLEGAVKLGAAIT